jgi:hypothetical protein
VSTVGQHGTEEVIKQYLKEQDQDPEKYQQWHTQQLSLFDF